MTIKESEFQSTLEEIEEMDTCPAGKVCSFCNTEIKEMYDDHPCLGHYCQCGRNHTD